MNIVSANSGSGNQGLGNISILPGRGDGTFGAAVTIAAGRYPSLATVGDFNGDHIPDIAAATSANGTGNDVTVYPGKGDGQFQSGFQFLRSADSQI